jgi:hypothetical protein
MQLNGPLLINDHCPRILPFPIRSLLEATLTWRRCATWMLSLLCVVAILSGCSAAMGFFGAEDRAVNVIWTLLGLIGMPVLALLFWIVTPLLGGRIGAGAFGGFWLWLMTHAPRFGGNDNRAAQVVVVRGLAAMTGRSRSRKSTGLIITMPCCWGSNWDAERERSVEALAQVLQTLTAEAGQPRSGGRGAQLPASGSRR